MALDGIFLHHIKGELEFELAGSRVDKIFQPGKDEIVINMRLRDGMKRLLLSSRVDTARVSITDIQPENPLQPPMFCMLLRKKIQGAKLIGIEQNGLERVLCFIFESVNELGDYVTLKLYAEIMGKFSNIVLVDEKGIIIEAIKRVYPDMSTERILIPGTKYTDPPAQHKFSILSDDINIMAEEIIKQHSGKLSKTLIDRIQGISPIIAREIEYQTFKHESGVFNEITVGNASEFVKQLDNLKRITDKCNGRPYIIYDLSGKPLDYSFIKIEQYGPAAIVKEESSFSQLLDRFYSERDQIQRIKARTLDLNKMLSAKYERTTRKINNQKVELEKCKDRDNLRLYGDLIQANLNVLKPGMTSCELVNYYDEKCPKLTVKLDPSIGPNQNAQKYFKEYRKSKTAEVKLKEQIEIGMQELNYIDSVLYSLSEAKNEKDINELRTELEGEGYVKARIKGRPKKEASTVPLKKESPGGLKILIGRNNRQNDKLTLKDASKNDLWFHTKNIPGSHVILVTGGNNPDEEDLRAAATEAALHSKAKNSSLVPVDYTKVRYVSKPQGAKPGMVIYVNQKTIYVRLNQSSN
jgi:predicted ribosome quality control (RQC) complex YloA/Tae2 family protein